MMSSLRLIGILALTAVVITACSKEEAPAPVEQKPLNVRTLEIQPTDLEESIVLSGRLMAIRAADLSTEESGVISSIEAEKGETVKKGAVVIMLDRGLLDAERKSAEAAMILRSYNEERTRSLYEANSVSKQEMLIAHTDLQVALQNHEVAKLRYERAGVKAHFDGIVTDRYVELGELVAAGQPVARVVDPYTLELEGSVTEREIPWVREGAPAEVSVDGWPSVFNGEVSYVGFEASPMSGKFSVEIRIDNSDLQLRSGVVARARVQKQVHTGTLAIPRDAIVRVAGQDIVYVVREDHAVQVPVDLGSDQGLMVVVESGLFSGDQLVVRGQRQLQNGQPVLVQEEATARDGGIVTDPPVVREEGALEKTPIEIDANAAESLTEESR